MSHPPLLPAYAPFAPYNEDSAIRIVGSLVAAKARRSNSVVLATIRVGEPVRVVFDPVGDDVTLPRWVRA